MRNHLGFLGVLSVAVASACGGQVAGSDLTQSTSSSSSSSGAPAGSGDEPPATLPAPPESPPPEPPPTPPSAGDYSAYYWGGGLDHITIAKADFGRDTCTRVHLAHPQTSAADYANVSVPATWGVTKMTRTKGATSCNPKTLPAAAQQASYASGVISWPAGPLVPCVIDIAVNAVFPGPESLTAVNVSVAGCQ
jgi:hypothetical protein